MIQLTKPRNYFVKVWREKIVIIDLDRDIETTTTVVDSFSNSRIVMAHFPKFEKILKVGFEQNAEQAKRLAKNLKNSNWLSSKFVILQQMEDVQEELCSIEIMGYKDALAKAGASKNVIVPHFNELSIKQAKQMIEIIN